MTELNGKTFPVKIIDYGTFAIGDTSQFHPYNNTKRAGYGIRAIMPKEMHFKELKEALKNPYYDFADVCCEGREPHVIISFFSLFKCIEENDTSVDNILKNTTQFNNEFHLTEQIDEGLIREFAREDAVISPTAATLGRIAGQEVIKSVSGKFTPFQMFFTLSSNEQSWQR